MAVPRSLHFPHIAAHAQHERPLGCAVEMLELLIAPHGRVQVEEKSIVACLVEGLDDLGEVEQIGVLTA